VQFVSEQKSIPADLASPKDETKSMDFILVNYEEPKVPNKLLSSLRALKAQTGMSVNPHLVKGKGTKEDPFEID
jgi:pentose-5-phosphate-3-epimerase